MAVLDLTGGIGADAALECVGTAQSVATAFAVARPGSTVGIVGVPHGQLPFAETFFRNTGWRGGPAPARIYIPELLGDVLDGVIDPELIEVFDNFAFDEVLRHSALDTRTRLIVQLAALIGCRSTGRPPPRLTHAPVRAGRCRSRSPARTGWSACTRRRPRTSCTSSGSCQEPRGGQP
jgi:hypothetical protein